MADKKINETILQQRKAREEFLKLKQMQNSNSAETVEKREEYKPRTFKEKLDNFWFHYKWHTIAILLALVVLCTGVSQCAGRTNYDMEMLEETGFCRGVENYARHLALKKEAVRVLTFSYSCVAT